ncbi:MAG: 3-deoxy-8-phosphooctulonate synthase [Candidatus Nitrospinota bacterium M3_3B_026]
MTITIEPGPVRIGSALPFVFIGGPCVIESEESALAAAARLKETTAALGIGFIYKSSYDKANRSSMESFRGVGMDEGLRVLKKIRDELKIPVLSDVHSPEEAEAAGEALDVLQIPAFLCRQTDLLAAAGRTGKVVNIKKGQFMAPWDMKNAVEKVRAAGGERVTLTERGTTFGYNRLVVDMTSLYEMGRLGVPVIFDAGHSVQSPGGLGHATGGVREHIPVLARSAVAAGVAGVFLETHPDPASAPCDGPNMWPMDELKGLLSSLVKIDRAVKG